MTDFLVAFVGLSSSGKSSVVNSLLFIHKFDEYLENLIDFDKLMNYWNKITDNQKINQYMEIIKNIIDEKTKIPNMKLYHYFCTMASYICKYLNYSQQLNVLLKRLHICEIMLVNPIYLQKTHNYYKDYINDDILDMYDYTFLKIPKKSQNEKLMNLLISDMPIDITIKLLNKLFLNNDMMYELNYKVIFNEICNGHQSFNRYAEIMKKFINQMKFKFQFTKYKNCSFETLINLNNYLMLLANDEEYILLNKIQIVQCLMNKTKLNCHLMNLFKSFDQSKQTRFLGNPEYRKTMNIIWKNIYSNIIIEYDLDNYIQFEPLDVQELYYNV